MAKKHKYLVCAYVRKSRLKDDTGLEIDRQLELLTDYAEKNEIEVVVFAEEGSSESWDRPELNKMLKELERGIYDGVLCTDQDRISRDRTDFGLFVRFMKAEGLLLFTLNKTFNFTNDDDIFVSGIQSEMDNHFMRITKRKLRRGRIQALQKGVYFGIAPYGYTKDSSKHLIPHPEESKVVLDIYNMYVNEGLNQAEIVEQLTLRGKMTRNNKPFTVRTLSIILSNVAYTGTLNYQLEGEELICVEDAHPSLIDIETFNLTQQIRKTKRIVPQSSQRGIYVLSRLIVCLNCNQSLSFCMKYNKRSARNTLDKSQRELYVLNCHASKSQLAKQKDKNIPRCNNNGIKSSRVEKELLKRLKQKSLDIDHEIEKMTEGDTSFLSKVAIRQNELSNQYNKLNDQRKKVQDGFKMGIYDDVEAASEISKIKEMQESIQQELKSLEGKDIKSEIDKKKKFKKKLDMVISDFDMNCAKLNKFLHELIDKILYLKVKPDIGKENPFLIDVIFKD